MRTTRAGAGTSRPIRWGAIAALVGLIAAGCSDDDGTTFQDIRAGADTTSGDTVELDGALIAALERYDSCDAFLADVKAEALDEVGPYGLGGGPMMYASRGMEGAESTGVPSIELMGGDDSASSDESSGPGGADVSGTNVQEEGVDEPDVVKTNGQLLAVVDDSDLQLVDVSDPSNPTLLSTTPLAGWDAQLLLRDDTLLVLQNVNGVESWGGEPAPRPADTIGTPDESLAEAPETTEPGTGGVATDMVAPGWMTGLATITQVDVSDPTEPQVERTWTVEGGYTSARMVDGVVRVVVQGDPSSNLPFVYPSTESAEDAAEAANRAVIEASTIEDWVPALTTTDGDGNQVSASAIAPCDRLYRPSTFSGFGIVGVLTADLADDLGDGNGVGLLSTGETVYASTDNLYVATHRWASVPVMPMIEEDATSSDSDQVAPEPEVTTTEVHQFALTGADPAEYVASGSVEGTILDQWSLSEHDDHLRMAVTSQPTDWTQDGTRSSSVVVLARDGDALVETGRVDDLGKGEDIYAVRFMGDLGYVVTFRQIDPLYSIDLSDPTNPAMTGELKITGFSSYLHPVGDGLLLGIGQEATEEGRVTGGQVSLFDVSDPANPQRVSQLDLGTNASSEVEYDHRAFLFWDGLALLPVTAWSVDEENGEELTSAAIGIDVGPGTLDERGRVTHVGQREGAIGEPAPTDPAGSTRPFDPDSDWNAQIRRSVVIGDTLLTVSGKGVLASNLATLEPTTWMPMS